MGAAGGYFGRSMKRILTCLDASPRAPFVLQTAADLAQRTGAKLVLLRSVGLPAEIDQEFYVHAAGSMTDILVDKAKKELDVLAKAVSPGIIEGFDVHIGTPWDTICREAKAREADMVILGSHGYSGMDRILGTTAAKVVNHCEVSVLVARQKAEAAT